MNKNLCNKNASPNAKKLMNYLADIEGKGIITGQHTQTRLQEELLTIERETGKLPALCGFELLAYSPNIDREHADDECMEEVLAADGTIDKAYEWAEKGGIITFTWHWFSPLYGHDKAFYTRNTEFDARKALIDGTEENIAMKSDLDVMAGLLKGFCDKDIPILWRPFHENEGDWFWWGAHGMEVAKDLYKFMWHYFVDKYQLNNLIWVWNNPRKEGYVGDDYCDIFTRDLYPEAHNHTDLAPQFNELYDVTKERGIAVGETGVIPDIEALSKTRVPWLWYMTWSKVFCVEETYNSFDELRKMYSHPYAITLDDVKGIY